MITAVAEVILAQLKWVGYDIYDIHECIFQDHRKILAYKLYLCEQCLFLFEVLGLVIKYFYPFGFVLSFESLVPSQTKLSLFSILLVFFSVVIVQGSGNNKEHKDIITNYIEIKKIFACSISSNHKLDGKVHLTK